MLNVFITPFALEKLDHYASAALPTEIGGLAKIDDNGKGTIIVTDVHFFPQRANAAHFDITPEDINAFTKMLMDEGRIDELEKWPCIVHSHPIGMTAHMSQTDVEAIERYAMEQDAFSLIMSANNTPGSAREKIGTERLLMHYCATMRGTKSIVRDMKVGLAYMNERAAVGAQVAKLVVDHYKLGDKDAEKVAALAHTFVTTHLPGLWIPEVAEVAADAIEQVAKLIERPAVRQYGFQHGDGGWRGHMYDPPTVNHRTNAWDEHEDAWRRRVTEIDNDERASKHMRMVSLSNGFDADGKAVSKNEQKRAQKWLNKQATRNLGTEVVKRRSLCVGDWVTITDVALDRIVDGLDVMQDHEYAHLENLTENPGQIDAITPGGMFTVDGFDFLVPEVVEYDFVAENNLPNQEVYG